MTSQALARQGGWRASKARIQSPPPAWTQKDRVEFEEHEAAGNDGGWTVGYLDVLLILVTLFAALLGATLLQMDDLRSLRASEAPAIAAVPAPAEPARTAETVADPAPSGGGSSDPAAPVAASEPAPVAPAAETPLPVQTAAIDPEPAPTAAVVPVANTVTETRVAVEEVTPVIDGESIAAALAPAIPAEFAVFMDLVAAHGEQQNLELLLDRHQLRLEVGNDILFPSGTADLADAGRSLLAELSDALSDERLKISVEGHTDDVPISTARFPSNWELSSIRATTVARELIALGVPQQRLRVTGYADTRPRAVNDSPTNRALNRRVSLVLEVVEDPLPPQ
nr:OmpA family protein [Thioalkalivibrio sp.]